VSFEAINRSTLSPKPTSVLLVDDAGYGVLAAVRALRAAGYAPWLAVSEPRTYAARSRAVAGTVPIFAAGSDGHGFVRTLAAAKRLSVAAVLPSAEVHFLDLAGREVDFPGIALGSPSRETVKRAFDKTLLPELAVAAGLRTPPTIKVVCGRSETLGTFGFPAVVKPPRSQSQNPDGTVSYHSVRYVSSVEEAEEALEVLGGGEGLLQPYITGSLVSVSGVSWEGKLVCALHQFSARIWPMLAGVSSYAQTIPPNLELEQRVGHLLRSVSWSGLFQAQFIRNIRGEHYFIDLNPRIYGSLALAVAAGLNLPEIWVNLLLGRRPDVSGYRVGTRFRQEEKDVRALARILADGGETRWRALRGLVPRRSTTHAVFSLRDPMPLLTSAAKLAARLKPTVDSCQLDGIF
jgi:predicted ATP-grasp superfamily ATP-dependent carboligase